MLSRRKRVLSALEADHPRSGRSISKDLTISIVLVVLVVSTLVISLNYLTVSRNSEMQLQEKTDEYASYLTDSLELPLWIMADDVVQYICRSYMKNELISRLRVTMAPVDRIAFEESKDDGEGLVLRELDIVHQGEVVGRLQIGLTSRPYKEANRRLLWSSVVIIVVIVLVLLAVTGILLRVFLKRPLDFLVQGIDRIASGDYEYRFPGARQREIEAIISRFNHMAKQVDDRDESLTAVNRRLEEMISDLRQAQAQLKESEEKYRYLFESAPDGIVITTLDGSILALNKTAAHILKLHSSNSMTQCNMSHFYVNQAEALEMIEQLNKLVQLEDYRIALRDMTGRLFPGSISARLAHYEGEMCIQSIIRDITTLKEMESKLKSYADNLEQMVNEKTSELKSANEELSRTIRDLEETREQLAVSAHQAGMAELAVSVLHNIGNAINSINVRSYDLEKVVESLEIDSLEKVCEMLRAERDIWKSNEALEERRRKIADFMDATTEVFKKTRGRFYSDLGLIRRSIEHVMEIVVLQQKYAGVRGRETWVEVNELLKDAAEMLGDSMVRRGIRLELELGDAPPLLLDRNKMIQIFINIFKNAYESIDMAAPNGEKRIVAHTSVKESQNERFVRIEIADSGVGIAREDREKLFRFGYSTKKRGSGFGLHDAANYIKAQGGIISLFSEELDMGARLVIELPVTGAS